VGRRRAPAVLSSASPIVKHKPSLIGLSPAQVGFYNTDLF
jgi:hypothetical protein